MAGLSHNAGEIIRRMQARPAAVEREMNAATRELVPKAVRLTKGKLEAKVYGPPEKRRKNGKKEWSRTGDLKRRETARAEGVHLVMENKSDHAAPRHALGSKGAENRAGRHPIAPQQSTQWQTEAAEELLPEALEARRTHLVKALANP